MMLSGAMRTVADDEPEPEPEPRREEKEDDPA